MKNIYYFTFLSPLLLLISTTNLYGMHSSPLSNTLTPRYYRPEKQQGTTSSAQTANTFYECVASADSKIHEKCSSSLLSELKELFSYNAYSDDDLADIGLIIDEHYSLYASKNKHSLPIKNFLKALTTKNYLHRKIFNEYITAAQNNIDEVDAETIDTITDYTKTQKNKLLNRLPMSMKKHFMDLVLKKYDPLCSRIPFEIRVGTVTTVSISLKGNVAAAVLLDRQPDNKCKHSIQLFNLEKMQHGTTIQMAHQIICCTFSNDERYISIIEKNNNSFLITEMRLKNNQPATQEITFKHSFPHKDYTEASIAYLESHCDKRILEIFFIKNNNKSRSELWSTTEDTLICAKKSFLTPDRTTTFDTNKNVSIHIPSVENCKGIEIWKYSPTYYACMKAINNTKESKDKCRISVSKVYKELTQDEKNRVTERLKTELSTITSQKTDLFPEF